MDYRMAIEFVHGGHDAILEFLFGFDTDVAQHRASELGEKALMRLSQEPCLGVNTNSKRPVG